MVTPSLSVDDPPLAGDEPDAQRPGGAWGSEVSNTDPQKYIPLNLQVLRVAVDSLYLSGKGKLYEDRAAELAALKDKAQSEDQSERLQAQLKVGGHLFEVKDRGTQFYAFILEDNCFGSS